MFGDDPVLSADDDDVVARVDREAGADPTGGHRVVAFVVSHERLDAYSAGCAAGHLVGMKCPAPTSFTSWMLIVFDQ